MFFKIIITSLMMLSSSILNADSLIFERIKPLKDKGSQTTQKSVSLEMKLIEKSSGDRIEVKIIVNSDLDEWVSVLIQDISGSYFATSISSDKSAIKGKSVYTIIIAKKFKERTRFSVFVDNEYYHLHLEDFDKFH